MGPGPGGPGEATRRCSLAPTSYCFNGARSRRTRRGLSTGSTSRRRRSFNGARSRRTRRGSVTDSHLARLKSSFNGARSRRTRRGGNPHHKRVQQLQLQWGPVPEDQERTASVGRRRPAPLASMGPGPGGPGRQAVWLKRGITVLQWGPVPEDQERGTEPRGGPARPGRFNGARSRRTRRGPQAVSRKRFAAVELQWGPVPEDQERQDREPRHHRALYASMGPGPGGPGEAVSAVVAVWAAFASMGPGPGGPGEEFGRGVQRADGRHASMGPGPGGPGEVAGCLHHAGRLPVASMGPGPGGPGEGHRREDSSPEGPASMGPGPGGPGEGTSPAFFTRSERSLQWGPVPEDQERRRMWVEERWDVRLQWGPVPEDQERPRRVPHVPASGGASMGPGPGGPGEAA